MIAESTPVTREMAERGFDANRDGGGIAWRENGKVHWRKGLDRQTMIDACLSTPTPYVAHFRIASCGGVRSELTHPFPVDKLVPLELEGSTKGGVLFHNGHWTPYKTTVFAAAAAHHLHVPPGKWSDSRALAWMAFHHGTGILEMIDEKTVVLSPTETEVFGTGWSKVNDIWVSNRGWEARTTHVGGYQGVCKHGRCKKSRLSNSDWCFSHQTEDERKADPEGTGGGRTDEDPFRGASSVASGATHLPGAVRDTAVAARSGGEDQAGKGAASRQTEIGSLATKADMEALRWARSLNPKEHHGGTPLPTC